MKVLKIFRAFFLVLALCFLFSAVYKGGTYQREKRAAEDLRAIEKPATDPEDPGPAQRSDLLWALKFGAGGGVCWLFLWALGPHPRKGVEFDPRQERRNFGDDHVDPLAGYFPRR